MSLAAREHNPYGPLRELVAPYILRRMKTDKSIIADLPEKTEVKAHCHLSRKQAALYAQAVDDLGAALDGADGIARKGLVLASLMRLKQICNHPSQWLADHAWKEEDSGKCERLREIAEVIASRQEKMLVFTQFRAVIDPLAALLEGLGRPGLTLHGETEVRKRKLLVRISRRTSVSHSSLRRRRRRKNVLVHKFVYRGTVEEKINAPIESKGGLRGNCWTDPPKST